MPIFERFGAEEIDEVVACGAWLEVPRGHGVFSAGSDSRAAFVSLGRENQVIGIDLERRCIFARFDVASTPDGIGWGPSSGAR